MTRRGPLPTRLVAIALFGLVLIFFGFSYYSTTGGPRTGPSISISDVLLLIGSALEAVAITLVVRFLWIRARG